MSSVDQLRHEQGERARFKRPRWHHHPGVRSAGELSFGERAADVMRNGMGSWTFVFLFLGAMAFWMTLNSFFEIGHPLSSGSKGFDPYPYILLNLVLSTLAGLQAAALLIAAKRADGIAAEIAMHTLENTETDRVLLEENTALTRQVRSHTELLDELHRHVSALSEHFGLTVGHFPPKPVEE
jgi:uncharacterized membrane protein